MRTEVRGLSLSGSNVPWMNPHLPLSLKKGEATHRSVEVPFIPPGEDLSIGKECFHQTTCMMLSLAVNGN